LDAAGHVEGNPLRGDDLPSAPFVVVLGASFDTAAEVPCHLSTTRFSLAGYAAIPLKYALAAGVSVIVALIVAAASTVIGLCAASAWFVAKLSGREVLQSFFRLPVQIPFVVHRCGVSAILLSDAVGDWN